MRGQESTQSTPDTSQEILLVDDGKTHREALAKQLSQRGFQVRQAATYREAIEEVEHSGRIDIVLMDRVLGDAMDGLAAAEAIQRIHPMTSFIFVSTAAGGASFRQRVERSHIRLGGLIEKPLNRGKLAEIARLIDKEKSKIKLLARLAKTRDPLSYLHGLADGDPTLPREVVAELIRELSDAEHRKARDQQSEQDEGEPNMKEVAAEIDNLYGRIRDLVVEQQGDPELGEALRPLRARLRKLQEVEADEMERRYRARVRFDPARGQCLLDRAARLLAKDP